MTFASRTTLLFVAIGATATAVLLGAQAYVRSHATTPWRIEIPAEGVTLPMQDIRGLPLVEVRINGHGPYRFILDTGASATVVSPALSQELALPPLKGITAAPLGNRPAPALVQIDELRVGDAVLGAVFAAVIRLDELFGGEDAPRGVLSAGNFPGYLVAYDYPGKRISIKPGSLGAADSQGTFEYSGILPSVPVRIAGREVRVDLDTGSVHGLVLPSKWLSQLPLASEAREVDPVRTPAGSFPAKAAKVAAAVEVGKYKLNLPEVRFSDARGGNLAPAGTLGYVVLRNFIVTLDSKNRRVRLDQ